MTNKVPKSESEQLLLEWIIENQDSIKLRHLGAGGQRVGVELVEEIRRDYPDIFLPPESGDAIIGNFPTGLPGKTGMVCITPEDRVQRIRGIRYIVTLTIDGLWRAIALSSPDDVAFIELNRDFVDGYESLADLVLMLRLGAH